MRWNSLFIILLLFGGTLLADTTYPDTEERDAAHQDVAGKQEQSEKDKVMAAIEKEFLQEGNSSAEEINSMYDPSLNQALKVRAKVGRPEFVVCAAGKSLPFLVSHAVAKIAYERNKNLNESILFSTYFLKQRHRVRNFLHNKRHFNGKYIKTKTTDGAVIHYTHFDRGSDTLLLIGGGLMNQERVASFVKMFNQYDVVIFNHRGVEYNAAHILYPRSWSYLLADSCISEGLNGKKVTLGQAEEKDVLAVVYDVYKHKKYKKVYGLALSYSAPIFIKAATIRPGLFDKLMLDGCWISIDHVIDRIVRSIGAKDDTRFLTSFLPTSYWWFRNFLMWLGEHVSQVKYSYLKFDFIPYLQRLTIPVLFIHSVRDKFISSLDFNRIWMEVPSSKKAVILTTYNHARNHLKRKELYKYIADSFFGLSYDDFLASLQVPIDSCP